MEEIKSKVGSLAHYKINNLMDRFKEKQQIESSAVLKKFESGKLKIEKSREKDLQDIIRKYQALKENLDSRHRSEENQMKKDFLSFKPNSNLILKSLLPPPSPPEAHQGEEDNSAHKDDDDNKSKNV